MATLRNVGIMAIGSYLPERVMTNDELATMVDTSDEWIRARIGVRTRHIAAPEELSSDLGAAALRDACRRAGIDLDEIDLVICGSNTPDHPSPQTASMIMRKVGLSGTAGFDVRCGGCAGGVFALDVGSQYVATGRYRTVAVVLAEVNSKITNWKDRTTCVILGDGAACYLLRPCGDGVGIQKTILGTDPSGYYVAYVPAGGRAMPVTAEAAEQGLQYFVMQGRPVLDFAHNQMPPLIRQLAAESGHSLDDVQLFVTHQANINIINNIMDLIGQPRQKTYTNVERRGNTSSASVPLALCEAVDDGCLKPGDLLFAVAFGAGLTYGACAIRWCGPDDFSSHG
ncbi:MAG: ketoacyl-ACP synthase III [Micromonosporaceae bacterium]|nr:ketoacyl-ACP synthase III [Micromonosporaceae bacterium]